MDMFEFSIEMEKNAEALYRKMADNAPVEGIKKVLLMLAEDEVRHRVAIENLQKKLAVAPAEGVALDIKTVFEEMKQDENITQLSVDAVEDYQKAVEIERRGMEFYIFFHLYGKLKHVHIGLLLFTSCLLVIMILHCKVILL